jgi:hypothetical protein
MKQKIKKKKDFDDFLEVSKIFLFSRLTLRLLILFEEQIIAQIWTGLLRKLTVRT